MRNDEYDVVVFGLGYIGLPTASIIASSGMRVCGVDVSERVVDTINRGAIHIEEKDLDQLVERVVKDKMLCASLDAPQAQFHVIAVPTPLLEDNTPGLDYVMPPWKRSPRSSARRLHYSRVDLAGGDDR